MGFNIPMGLGSALSGAAGAYNKYAEDERNFNQQKDLAQMAFDNHLKQLSKVNEMQFEQEKKVFDWKQDQEKLHRKAQAAELKQTWEQDNDIVDDDTKEYRKWSLDLWPIYGERTPEVVNTYINSKDRKLRKDLDAQSDYIDRINGALQTASPEQLRSPVWQAETKRKARMGLKIRDINLLDKVDDSYFPKIEKEWKDEVQKYTIENEHTGEVKPVFIKPGQSAITPEMKQEGWRLSTTNPEFQQLGGFDPNTGNAVLVGSRTGKITQSENPGGTTPGPKTAPTIPAELTVKRQQIETANDVLGEIEKSYKPEYVGVVKSRIGKFEDVLDVGSNEDRAYFRKMLGKLFNSMIYLRSGKQINENEADRLANEFMSQHPSETEYKAGIRGLKFELKSIQKNMDKEIKSAGYNQKGSSGSTKKLTPEEEAAQYLKGK